MLNFGSKPRVSHSPTHLSPAKVRPTLGGSSWLRVLAIVAAHAALLNACSGEPGEIEPGAPGTEQRGDALLQTRASAAPNTADDQSFVIEGAAPDRAQGASTEGETQAKAETFTCKLTCTNNGWTCGNDCFGSEGTWCWTENQWQGGHWGGWSPYVCVSASGTTTYH